MIKTVLVLELSPEIQQKIRNTTSPKALLALHPWNTEICWDSNCFARSVAPKLKTCGLCEDMHKQGGSGTGTMWFITWPSGFFFFCMNKYLCVMTVSPRVCNYLPKLLNYPMSSSSSLCLFCSIYSLLEPLLSFWYPGQLQHTPWDQRALLRICDYSEPASLEQCHQPPHLLLLQQQPLPPFRVLLLYSHSDYP